MKAISDRAASWRALGTGVELRLAQPGPIAEARAAVEAELMAIDFACSRFRADSELCRLNATAGEATLVSPLLLQALDVALRAAEVTEGDVDPTVGDALERAGYDRDFSLLEAPTGDGDAPPALRWDQPRINHFAQSGSIAQAPRVRVHRRPRWRAIEVDRARRVVSLPPGVKLDLGATAKAWAADRAALAASKAIGGTGVLVCLGGDVAAAGPAPQAGWRIHVTDDHRSDPSAPGQTVAVHGGGLATSSTAVRRWRHQGTQMHHIIDPETGAPCEGPWRTVSVAAVNCTDANIASTAAILRGHRAPQWLSSLRLPARLVTHNGVVLRLGDWPAHARSVELLAA